MLPTHATVIHALRDHVRLSQFYFPIGKCNTALIAKFLADAPFASATSFANGFGKIDHNAYLPRIEFEFRAHRPSGGTAEGFQVARDGRRRARDRRTEFRFQSDHRVTTSEQFSRFRYRGHVTIKNTRYN